MDGRGFGEAMKAGMIVVCIIGIVGGILVWELVKFLFSHLHIGWR